MKRIDPRDAVVLENTIPLSDEEKARVQQFLNEHGALGRVSWYETCSVGSTLPMDV